MSLTGDDTKGRWRGIVIGFTTGTTVTTSAIASALATPIAVTGTTAGTPSSWVLVGSASDGVGPNNWSTPAGYTKIIDVDANNSTPPDIFVAPCTTLAATVPSVSAGFGVGDTAKAVLIASADPMPDCAGACGTDGRSASTLSPASLTTRQIRDPGGTHD